MEINRKRVARRIVSGLVAGAVALGGLAISGGSVSAKTPDSPTTKRVYGADRYETAVALARNAGNSPTSGLVIASGESYADALAAAALSSANRPILLVRKDSIPASVSDYISDYVVAMSSATPTIYVVGGESVISSEVFDGIKAAVTLPTDTTPPTVKRVSGDDRYATALQVGLLTAGPTDKMLIVSGTSWADALSASNISAETGWPIALAGPSGLDASGIALVDHYRKLPGSVKSYVIIGGTSAVPSSVESYLISTVATPVKNIRRIAGADRYQTSLFTNVYLYDDTAAPLDVFNGDTVALVSGEAPWDGIASSHWASVKDSHIQLVPSAALETSGSTLSETLAGGAAYANSATDDNVTLWVIGGKSAIADAVKTAYIATSTAVNGTSTISDCNDGSTVLTLTLSQKLSANENSAFIANTTGAEASFVKNNAAIAAGSIAITNPSGDRKTYTVTLGTALTALDVIKFAGVAEGGALKARTIGGSSCTVVDDIVRPTVTITALAGLKASSGGEGGPHILVKASEPIKFSSGASSVTAGGLLYGSSANASTAALVTTSAKVDTDYATDWIITPNVDETTLGNLAVGDTVSLQAANIVDRGGNSPLSVATTAVADATAPVITVASADCSADGTAATRSSGNLTVTAADGGAWDGAVGNGFRLSVVNSRGLEIPTIAIDEDAKTIVVTVDTGYHSAEDVEAVAKSNFLESTTLGNWDFGGSGSLSTAATLVPLPLASGESTCSLLLVGDEPFQVGTAVAAIVNGLGSGYVGTLGGSINAHSASNTDDNKQMSLIVTHTTKTVGPAYLYVTTTGDNSINNVNGISVASTINYTVS